MSLSDIENRYARVNLPFIVLISKYNCKLSHFHIYEINNTDWTTQIPKELLKICETSHKSPLVFPSSMFSIIFISEVKTKCK